MSVGLRSAGLLSVPLCASSAQAKEPAKPPVAFLAAEQAAAAIADESLEPYFALLQPAEMEANEIFAVLFAMMVVKDAFGGHALRQSSEVIGKDFAKLRAWCSKNLVRKSPAPVR